MDNFMEQEFVNTELRSDLDRRMTRWIVFAGDRTPPDFKRRFDGMRLGGEYLGSEYKTLVMTKGLLRRCQITPMTIGHDDVNQDSLGGDYTRTKSRQVWDERANSYYSIYFYEILPGDEIDGLMQSRQGKNDDGVREIVSLRGIDPPRKDANGATVRSKGIDLQYEIFPDWDDYASGKIEFFKSTGELGDYLRDRKLYVSDDAIPVIDVILESNLQFELWATTELENMARFVKAPPTDGGKVYTFEKYHNQLFDQLSLQKEAFLTKTEPGARSTNPSTGEFAELRERYERLEANMDRLVQATLSLATKEEKAGERSEKATVPSCSALTTSGLPCKSLPKDGPYCSKHNGRNEATAAGNN